MRQLDLSKSSIYNYLNTLEGMEYVINEDRSYWLSLHFLSHGIAANNSLGITRSLVPTLQSAAEQLSQPTWWIVEEFGRELFLKDATPADEINTYGSVGKQLYYTLTHLGSYLSSVLRRISNASCRLSRITKANGENND